MNLPEEAKEGGKRSVDTLVDKAGKQPLEDIDFDFGDPSDDDDNLVSNTK